jgi:hypothetical protein
MSTNFKKKKGNETGTFWDKWDFFATPIPPFNLESNEQVGTSIGFITSLLLTTVVLAYAVMKFEICILRKKPLISAVLEENAREVDTLEPLYREDF